jgi:hypothetical protein
MKNRLAAFLCLAALQGGAAAQAPAPAPAVSRVELRDCGLYESKQVNRESDAASTSGRHNIVENRLVQATGRIPLKVGTSFGCHVVMHGKPEGAEATFRAVMRLPATDPATGGARVLSGEKSYPLGSEGFVGLTLREGANFVAGTWLLEIWVAGKKHAETKFSLLSAD